MDIDKAKTIFKKTIDKSNNIAEFIKFTIEEVYQQGFNDGKNSNVIDAIKKAEKENFENWIEHKTVNYEKRKELINQGKKAKFMNAFHGETWYDCPFCGESFEYYDTWYSRGFEKTEFKDIYKHKCGNYIYFE